MVDEDGNAWVLEYSTGPSLRMKPDWLKELHSGLLREAMQIVFDVEHLKRRNKVTEGPLGMSSGGLSSAHPMLDALPLSRWQWLYRADEPPPVVSPIVKGPPGGR
jgi:hypothetical protein